MSNPPLILQLRYRDDQMRITCDHYLEAFRPGCRTLVVFLAGGRPQGEVGGDRVIALGTGEEGLRGRRRQLKRELAALVAAERPALVLAHRWKSAPLAVAALDRAGLAEVPVFAVVHALGQMRSLSRRLTGRFILRRRCHFIGVSEAVREDILRSGFGLAPERVLALANALDIPATEAAFLPPAAARAELGLPAGVPVIGHIGRLVGAKDQASLIAACARLREAFPAARLVLIGAGKLEENLRRQAAQAGIAERVIFAGAVERAFRLLKAFDLFALTSVREGFPRVLLEAMAARLPIVATAAGGIPEVLGREVALCRPGDVAGIAAALAWTLRLDAAGRRCLGERNFRRLEENFSRPIFRRRLRVFAARAGVVLPPEGEREKDGAVSPAGRSVERTARGTQA